jgi:TonB family protein
MKTLTALALCGGLLIPGTALSQMNPAGPVPEWQSVAIIQTVDPTFPIQLTQLGVTRGDVQVTISTDSDGKLADWLVVAYSHKKLADEAVEAIKQWRFVPARMRGEAVGTTIEIFFHFAATGVVVSTTRLDIVARDTIFDLNRDGYQPCSLRELDRIPIPVTTIAPQYPAKLANKGVKGKVTVDFFIDETGATRMPSVSSHDNSELTALSVQALRQWKFEPPTRNGKPVLLRASQVFSFGGGK